jgi:hypothetical protein
MKIRTILPAGFIAVSFEKTGGTTARPNGPGFLKSQRARAESPTQKTPAFPCFRADGAHDYAVVP